MNWNSYKVNEFESVTRCYGCFGYGHVMRECRVKERICRQCGDSGHVMKDCKRPYGCRNCKMKKADDNHSVLSNECPEYMRALERMRNRISEE